VFFKKKPYPEKPHKSNLVRQKPKLRVIRSGNPIAASSAFAYYFLRWLASACRRKFITRRCRRRFLPPEKVPSSLAACSSRSIPVTKTPNEVVIFCPVPNNFCLFSRISNPCFHGVVDYPIVIEYKTLFWFFLGNVDKLCFGAVFPPLPKVFSRYHPVLLHHQLNVKGFFCCPYKNRTYRTKRNSGTKNPVLIFSAKASAVC